MPWYVEGRRCLLCICREPALFVMGLVPIYATDGEPGRGEILPQLSWATLPRAFLEERASASARVQVSRRVSCPRTAATMPGDPADRVTKSRSQRQLL